MDDDFNTANGISVLFELSGLANHYLLEMNTDSNVIDHFLNNLKNSFMY